MDLDADHKNKIGSYLTRVLAQALKDGEISEEGASDAASKLLATVDTLRNQEELVAFLTQLSNRWPIFSNYLVIERSKLKEQTEEKNIEVIEEALKTAGHVTASEIKEEGNATTANTN